MLGYNSSVLESLTELVETSQRTEAFLLNFENLEQRLYTFLLPPFSLSFTGQVDYDSKQALYDSLGRIKYRATQPLQLSLNNVLLRTPCYSSSVRPLVQELDDLRYPVQAGALSPPSLSLIIGQRAIQPLVLTRLSWDERNLSEGEPVEAVVSLQLNGFDRVQF